MLFREGTEILKYMRTIMRSRRLCRPRRRRHRRLNHPCRYISLDTTKAVCAVATKSRRNSPRALLRASAAPAADASPLPPTAKEERSC